MLSSMTGFGEARIDRDGWAVAAELRAVNSRYFKFSFRATEGFSRLEPRVEPLIREHVRRGTVQVNLRIERTAGAENYRLNTAALGQYWRDAQVAAKDYAGDTSVRLDALLALPGVVQESSYSDASIDQLWAIVQDAVEDATDRLVQMRSKEGAALAHDLSQQCDDIASGLESISQRAPTVVDDYRIRIADRVNQSLADLGVSVEPADLVREIALFCDRADISEEVVRLNSHLQQFRAALSATESAGRRLEFIAQEMGREVNTIGSKANDTQIAQNVVDIKAALERIREQIQNVE